LKRFVPEILPPKVARMTVLCIKSCHPERVSEGSLTEANKHRLSNWIKWDNGLYPYPEL